MLVFTLRILRGCRLHAVRSLAVHLYNFLEGSARLSRVYARPSRGSRVDREPPKTNSMETRSSHENYKPIRNHESSFIVEHRRLSPNNSSQNYILYVKYVCVKHKNKVPKEQWKPHGISTYKLQTLITANSKTARPRLNWLWQILPLTYCGTAFPIGHAWLIRLLGRWYDLGHWPSTFWLGNVLRATTACTFSTSQLPKVVRPWCVLYILTWKGASRHNGVHFFNISASKSGPDHGVFCTFWLGNVLRATTACTFSTSQLPKAVRTWGVLYILTWKCALRHNGVQFFISPLASWLRTRRFSEPTFRHSGATNHWKNTVFRDFPTFSRICIFCPLTLSLLIFFLLIFLFSMPLPCSAFHLSILSEVWLLNFLRWNWCAISPSHVVLQCFGWDACSRSSGTKWHKSLLGRAGKKWDPSWSIPIFSSNRRMSSGGCRRWMTSAWQPRRDRVACPSHRPRTCDGLCQRSGGSIRIPRRRTLGSSDPPAHPPGRRVAWARLSPSHRHGTAHLQIPPV